MPDDPRGQLSREQGAFLERLNGVHAPEAFDARKLETAGAALARKRVRSVAKAWPRLAIELGPAFSSRFAAYAHADPWPPGGGPHADGWLFAHRLAHRDELGDEGMIELAAARLRFRWSARDQQLLAGPAFRVIAALLPHSRRRIIALRLFRREWWWNLNAAATQGAPAAATAPSSLASATPR